MAKKYWIALLFIMLLGGGALLVGPLMSNVETPKYTVIQQEGTIEIRSYPPMMVAQVQVSGPRKDSIRAGFKILADYIFGNNTPQKDISMTAPVQIQKSTKISMTAPVQQQQMDGEWVVSFVMPREFNLKTLPKPNNKVIHVKQIPTTRLLAIRFKGGSSDDNLEKHRKLLTDFASQHNIPLVGAPIYAFYNPPWTLPFLRRNEIMYALEG